MSSNIYTTYLSIDVEQETIAGLTELRDIIREIVANEGRINQINANVNNIGSGGGGGGSMSTMDILAEKMEQLRGGNIVTQVQFLNDIYTRENLNTNMTEQLRQSLSATFGVAKDEVEDVLGNYIDYLREEAAKLIVMGNTGSTRYNRIISSLQKLTDPNQDILLANEVWYALRTTLPNEVVGQKKVFGAFDKGVSENDYGYVASLAQLQAPLRPNTRAELTDEERELFNKYWYNTNRIEFTPEQYGKISELNMQYLTADNDAARKAAIDEMINEIKDYTKGKELGLGENKYILPIEAPKDFWERAVEELNIDDDYEKIMKKRSRSETDIKLSIKKWADKENFFNELKEKFDEDQVAVEYLNSLEKYLEDKFKDADPNSPISIAIPLKKLSRGGVSAVQVSSDELVNTYRAPYLFSSIGNTDVNRINVISDQNQEILDRLTDVLNNVNLGGDPNALMGEIKNELDNIKRDIIRAVDDNDIRPGGL